MPVINLKYFFFIYFNYASLRNKPQRLAEKEVLIESIQRLIT